MTPAVPVIRVSKWRQVLVLEGPPLVALAVAKVLVLGYGVLVAFLIGGVRVESPHTALDVWRHWDVQNYLTIAEHGYSTAPDERILVFFPLFPMLIAATAIVLRDFLLSGFALATAVSLAAVIALHRLASRDETAEASVAAVLFLLIFPTSFVLHIPYTEGLFLGLALSAFLAARDDRWFVASTLSALAAFTRINGLLLLFALAVEAFASFRVDHKLRWAWGWLLLIPVGTLGYLLVNQVVAGDPFRFLALERTYWDKTLDWPWAGVFGLLIAASEPSPAQVIWVGELLFIGVCLIATVAAAFWLRPSYATWTAANTLLFISTGTPLSVPRYALLLFPLFILLGRLGRRKAVPLVIAVPSVGLLCFLVGRFALDQWAY